MDWIGSGLVIFFGRAAPLFGSKSTINRFGERFRDGQYSLVSFLFAFFYSRCPRAQQFVKVGGARAPPCPMESAPLHPAKICTRKSSSAGHSSYFTKNRCILYAQLFRISCSELVQKTDF